jgi:hypothetical protein
VREKIISHKGAKNMENSQSKKNFYTFGVYHLSRWGDAVTMEDSV